MTVEFLFDFSALEKLQAALEVMPELFEAEFVQGMGEAVDILYTPLAQYPASPSYPIHWDSKRQRDAFFATNGFGGGIPHQRDGEVPDSWRGEIATTPSVIRGSVFSQKPGIRYVQDRNFQSNIHKGRWTTIQDDLEQNHARVQEVFVSRANAALKRVAEMLK